MLTMEPKKAQPVYRKFDREKLKTQLVHYRKAAGLTQKQVESKLGLRALAMHDYETLRLQLPIGLATELANLYRCSLEQLLGLRETADSDTPAGIRVAPLLELGIVGGEHAKLAKCLLEDPELAGYLAGPQESLFAAVTDQLSTQQKRSYLLEVLRYVNSLLGADGRISAEALTTRDQLLAGCAIDPTPEEEASVKRALTKPYFGGGVDKIFPHKRLKHFLIWLLYMVASSNGDIDYREDEYITAVSGHIGLEIDRFEFIRERITQAVREIF